MSKNVFDIGQELMSNAYPGRGIILGRTSDNKKNVIAYFIMGRSENSRNRVFTETEDGIRTEAFDPSKMVDPSLIIYHPVRLYDGTLVVTNGDQTDTICQYIENGGCFRDALLTRTYEPDAPNYTPRISGAVCTADHKMSYLMSVLRKDEESENCRRFFYKFSGVDAGVGHIIHTYGGDGDPLPSFSRAPVEIEMGLDAESVADEVWQALNEDNRVSLFVRELDLKTNQNERTVIINRFGADAE